MLLVFLWQPRLVLAQAAKSVSAAAQKSSQAAPPSQASPVAGMVITGDREAPLVLSIIPWVEPKPVTPPVIPLQALLPKVIDYNRPLLEEPDNQPVGIGARGRAAP